MFTQTIQTERFSEDEFSPGTTAVVTDSGKATFR